MNRSTTWAGQTVEDHGNFNLYYVDGWQYDYDAQNRLVTVTDHSTPRASFVYDGLGRCVKRTINGVTRVFNYDGWQPIYEWGAPGQFVAWNAYGAGADEILFRSQAGIGHLRYHTDRHGNVTALLDDSGTVVEKYSYDAFGQATITYSDGSVNSYWAAGSAVGNRFMFQGREYFNEFGLYDFRNRFYDPGLGRFYQTDPLGFGGGDANLFRYCGGDPINKSDATGLNVDEGYHWGDLYVPHWYFGVDDPTSGTGKTWFNFYPPTGNILWGRGQWDYNSGQPSGYIANTTWVTTPAQDLVIRSAFIDATSNPGTYCLFGNNCNDAGRRIIQNALGPQGTNFNPVDPDTGNIFDANGNWVGWQDPDTGDIDDSDGDWAGTNRTIGSYGTADGYGGGNFGDVGPNGFGGLGAGFGGVAGGFVYGIGGQGFGGIGNNSRGVTVTKLNLGKKPH